MEKKAYWFLTNMGQSNAGFQTFPCPQNSTTFVDCDYSDFIQWL